MKEIMSVIQVATQGSRLAGMLGLTREASIDALAKSYLEKLPLIFEPEVTRKALNKLQGGFMSPLNVHLRQEIERLNKLLLLVKDALETLRLALAGSIALG
jgi:dynein heavy chain